MAYCISLVLLYSTMPSLPQSMSVGAPSPSSGSSDNNNSDACSMTLQVDFSPILKQLVQREAREQFRKLQYGGQFLVCHIYEMYGNTLQQRTEDLRLIAFIMELSHISMDDYYIVGRFGQTYGQRPILCQMKPGLAIPPLTELNAKLISTPTIRQVRVVSMEEMMREQGAEPTGNN